MTFFIRIIVEFKKVHVTLCPPPPPPECHVEYVSRIWTSLTWLNHLMVGRFFTTAPAASKNDACFKNGQKRPKNNDLALLLQIRDTLYSLNGPWWRHQSLYISLCSSQSFPLQLLRQKSALCRRNTSAKSIERGKTKEIQVLILSTHSANRLRLHVPEWVLLVLLLLLLLLQLNQWTLATVNKDHKMVFLQPTWFKNTSC